MRKTIVKRQLECVLTNEEMLTYSKEMSKYLSEQMQAEGNQKAYASQMKAVIEEAKSHINSLNLKIGTGKEFREVECSVLYNWDKKTKEFFRLDTGEECGNDIITSDEIQEEMDFQEKQIKEAKEELIHMDSKGGESNNTIVQVRGGSGVLPSGLSVDTNYRVVEGKQEKQKVKKAKAKKEEKNDDA